MTDISQLTLSHRTKKKQCREAEPPRSNSSVSGSHGNVAKHGRPAPQSAGLPWACGSPYSSEFATRLTATGTHVPYGITRITRQRWHSRPYPSRSWYGDRNSVPTAALVERRSVSAALSLATPALTIQRLIVKRTPSCVNKSTNSTIFA